MGGFDAADNGDAGAEFGAGLAHVDVAGWGRGDALDGEDVLLAHGDEQLAEMSAGVLHVGLPARAREAHQAAISGAINSRYCAGE